MCVQVQGEQSFFGEEYEDTVDSVILGERRKLPEVALQALWLQTDEGAAWKRTAGSGRPLPGTEMSSGGCASSSSST